MFFTNLYRRETERKTLASLGLNVLAATRTKCNSRCLVDIGKLIKELTIMRNGIHKDDICAYADLVYGGVIKPNTLLRNIGIPKNDNRYIPEKLHKIITKDPLRKKILIQRVDFIIHVLAATPTIDNLTSI